MSVEVTPTSVTRLSVNRRTVLRRFAAATALASSGCTMQNEPGEDPGEGPAKPGLAPAFTRRLFAFDVIAAQTRTRLTAEIKTSGGVAGPYQPTINSQELQLIAWVEPDTAAELGKRADVVRFERVKPGEPEKSGIAPLRRQITDPPKDGRRHLFVILGPNSWPASGGAKGFHSTEDIANRWARKWKAQAGIEVEAVKAEKWSAINAAGVHIGATPGQIRVTIPGEAVPADVLKTIQSHPQVLRLQWDHADVIYNCPPCGMG